MALPIQTQAKIWTSVAAVTGVILWFLGDVLLPFVLAGAIAYCLDPLADRLERVGLGRIVAVVVISAAFLLIVSVGILLVLPTLVNQSVALINALPEYVGMFRNFLIERFPGAVQEGSTAHNALASVADTLKTKGAALLNTALTSAMSLVNVIVLIVIVPVVTFYLLIDWDAMTARIDDLLPRDHAPTIRKIMAEMDQTLAGFIRGQGTVCLILGTYYAGALMVAGLNFGLLIGAVAGLISFIPYVGSLVGGALAIGVAIVQFWDTPAMIVVIAAIFFSGQMLEGNYLTPKLVGGSVGLHPVWLLLALSVFGALFGFVGMLIAVPVSALIGVLVRFSVRKYLSGRLYLGLEAEKDKTTTSKAPDAAE
ncbi:MAG: AI-2E family transporter [Pseudomonadota bacterium]